MHQCHGGLTCHRAILVSKRTNVCIPVVCHCSFFWLHNFWWPECAQHTGNGPTEPRIGIEVCIFIFNLHESIKIFVYASAHSLFRICVCKYNVIWFLINACQSFQWATKFFMAKVWQPMEELLRTNVDTVRRADGSIDTRSGWGPFTGDRFAHATKTFGCPWACGYTRIYIDICIYIYAYLRMPCFCIHTVFLHVKLKFS